jgi:O-antigen ligase
MAAAAVAPVSRSLFGTLEALGEHLWALVPGLLVLFLGFDAGGFFAGTTGAAAASVAALAATRVLTARHPFSGLTGPTAIALVAIGAYAGWSLLSGSWSHAPARALLAFDRAALYIAVVALCFSLCERPGQMRTMIRGLAASIFVVCGAGLLTRTLPRVFPIAPGFLNDRLSYPVTYWNALALLAALGIALCVHLVADSDERAAVRALAAAAVPALGATLLLTFSRGGIAALVLVLIIYAALAPRASLLMTVVAVGPATAVAVVTAYDADQLATTHPTSPAAVAQGHHLAIVLAFCMVAAGGLTAVLPAAARRMPPVRPSRRARLAALAAALVGAIAVAAALGALGWISREYRSFTSGSVVPGAAPTRERLSSASNNGRLELWRVALHGFDAHPLDGLGAGTYVLHWQRNRPSPVVVQNAHSLYLETLDELGLVGICALVIFLGALLLAVVRAVRAGPERAIAAIAFATLVGWAAHAAIDWDWQMPVVTVPVLALAAAAGARPSSGPVAAPRVAPRIALAVGCVALGLAPAFVAVSQADLDASVRAFARGDCATAIAHARTAHSAVSSRPEPLEVIGYCEARHHQAARAEQAMRSAVSRDPNDWEFHYGLAVAIASGGADPRPQLKVAQRLNPHEPLIAAAFLAFGQRGASAWRRAATTVALDVP